MNHLVFLLLFCSLCAQVLTFSCIIGKDRVSSGLFALCVFPRAGVRALRPGGPGAEGTVFWAGHLTDNRHGQDGVTAELPLHILTCRDTSRFSLFNLKMEVYKMCYLILWISRLLFDAPNHETRKLLHVLKALRSYLWWYMFKPNLK